MRFDHIASVRCDGLWYFGIDGIEQRKEFLSLKLGRFEYDTVVHHVLSLETWTYADPLGVPTAFDPAASTWTKISLTRIQNGSRGRGLRVNTHYSLSPLA